MIKCFTFIIIYYIISKIFDAFRVETSNGARYSRMDQVKVAFHKFYLMNTSADIFLYIFLYMRTVKLIPMSGTA